MQDVIKSKSNSSTQDSEEILEESVESEGVTKFKFKRDRAYKFILRGARKYLKKKFYNSEYGKKVYRISDAELLEQVSKFITSEFPTIE